MVGGAERGMVEVSEGPIWINVKDGPMVLNGKVSGIEMPSVRTEWGHNALQLGQPVSTLLLSAPTTTRASLMKWKININ